MKDGKISVLPHPLFFISFYVRTFVKNSSMRIFKLFSAWILVCLSFLQLYAQPDLSSYNCYSLAAGKLSTIDGSVLLAHNEDAGGDLYVDWHKVERIKHQPGSTITLEQGAKLEQVAETYAFLWLQVPGLHFSDSYLNEWGLAIASNQCLSREDDPQLVDGGISYYLRRLMAERCKTAREAVLLAGSLIERFGYNSSGRTYLVADKTEAWLMAVVNGKHWVAQRVPDDHIAVIPNYYTIGEIDLADNNWFLGSRDIITYAVEKGWFDPYKGKRFNFREAYADPGTLHGLGNIPRHQDGINFFSEKQYGYYDEFPFSFKPKKKLAASDFMTVLNRHNEGTQFEMHPGFNQGNPHNQDIKRICSEINKYGVVAQLRSFLPDPIAHIMWVAPKRPCLQPFIPWYIGMKNVMEEYSRGNPQLRLENHFKEKNVNEQSIGKAFHVFADYADLCDEKYNERSVDAKAFKMKMQQKIFKEMETLEPVFIELYQNEPDKLSSLIDACISNWASETLNKTRELSEKGNNK